MTEVDEVLSVISTLGRKGPWAVCLLHLLVTNDRIIYALSPVGSQGASVGPSSDFHIRTSFGSFYPAARDSPAIVLLKCSLSNVLGPYSIGEILVKPCV